MPESILNITHTVFSLLEKQLLYSTLVFILVMVLTRLWSRKSPFLHFALWSLVLLRLVLPTDLAAPWSLRNLLQGTAKPQTPVIMDVPVGAEEHPGGITHQTLIQNSVKQTLSFGLLGLWACGSTILLTIFVFRRRHYRIKTRRACKITDPELLEQLAYWKKYLKIQRHITLLQSETLTTPFTIGLLNPVICLPAGVAQHKENAGPVIAHECAHIARYDDLQITLSAIVQAVYFFNPLVWYANLKLNQAREMLCDQRVLENDMMNRKIYVKSLINSLKDSTLNSLMPALLPEFGRYSQFIMYRIHTISRGRLMKTNNTKTGLAVLLLGLMVLPMAIYTPVTLAKSPAPAALATPADDSGVDFTCPLESGSITVGFQEYVDPFTHEKKFHQGVDIRALQGTDILAAADGTVAKVVTEYTRNKGRGSYLVIRHGNGLTSLYSHMNKISVSEGQTVTAGQVVGQVGTTGRSTGPHLHFEIMKDDEPVNPADYVDFNMMQSK